MAIHTLLRHKWFICDVICTNSAPDQNRLTGRSRAIIAGVQNVDTLRQKYGAELPEAEAIHSYYNRMRRQRGIPEDGFKGGWQEGEYRQFLPNFSAMQLPQQPRGSFYLRKVLAWGGVFAASVLCLRALE